MAASPKPPEQHKPLAVYAPFLVGGAALVVGLSLGVGRGDESPAPPPSSTTEASAAASDPAVVAPAASASDDDELPAFVPDLSGDDVGDVIVKTDEPAAGVARAGGRLLWLTSASSKLSQVLPAGGQPEELFAVKGDDQFGGSMTHSDGGVYWTVEQLEGGSAPIYFLAPPRGKPRQVAEGNSPDHLVLVEGKLHWSDRGTIMKLGDEPQVVAKREKRIAGLTGDARGIYWLEIDYQDGARGAHELLVLGADDEQPRRLERFKPPRQRMMLAIRGDELVWVEGREGKAWALRTASRAGGPARTLAATGEVSALTAAGGAIYWAEAHRRSGSDEVVTVLRRIAPKSNDAEMLGHMSGAVTALTADAESLVVGGAHGIAIVPLR